MIELHITGHPATQGSKKHVGNGRLVEMDRKLPAWRAAIIQACEDTLEADHIPYNGPLAVTASFWLPRPKKSSFGDHPAGPPDLDKLQRALGDGLTQAHAIHDDARIVHWNTHKLWAIQGLTGARVTIRRIGNETDL